MDESKQSIPSKESNEWNEPNESIEGREGRIQRIEWTRERIESYQSKEGENNPLTVFIAAQGIERMKETQWINR